MTCNDCLYGEKCYSRIRHCMDVDEGTGKLIEDIEKRCASFKNKADFVEVVRCKDCKYCFDAIMGGMWCEHPDNIMPLGSNPDDFCSYGERKKQ